MINCCRNYNAWFCLSLFLSLSFSFVPLVIVFCDSGRFGRWFRRSTNDLIIMKMSRFSNEENTVQSNRNREIVKSLTFNRTLIISFSAIKHFRKLQVYFRKKILIHISKKIKFKSFDVELFISSSERKSAKV